MIVKEKKINTKKSCAINDLNVKYILGILNL